MDFQDYVKIYKSFYRGIDVSQLANDCEISMHTLQNFDKDYNCLKRLEDIKAGCIANNINTLQEYADLINNHIRLLRPVFKDRALNSHKYQKNQISDSRTKFMYKLDAGKTYIAIDIKNAYSQYVDSLNVFDDKFDDIIFDGLPNFIRNGKKTRLFMYYQIPEFLSQIYNIIVILEKVLKSDHPLIKAINEHNLYSLTYNIDEAIFDISDCKSDFIEFIGNHEIEGHAIKVSIFEQHYISYITHDTKKEKTISVRDYTDRTYYATNECIYGNQLHKAYNNLPIVENDLYITRSVMSDKYIKLNEPIKITSIK